MRKFVIIMLALFVFTLASCENGTTVPLTVTTTGETISESPCKDTPLATDCFIPSDDLNFISPTPDEYTITENFESETVNQTPMNWLLYTNSEYETNGVRAKVVSDALGKYVEMYSDGLQKPLYPQSAPTPTFIFTTKFNLDQARSGIAYADLMVPEANRNAVSVGISTGAVNTVSVYIDNDLSLFVKLGGPFYYYSQNGDGGEYYQTNITVATDTWYSFRFEWDAATDFVGAYLVTNEGDVTLFEGNFHISNRFNAEADGEIFVPNVIKVTMPYGQSGYAYLDNVSVERRP